MSAFFRTSAAWALGGVLLLLAGQVGATTVYGTYVGPNVTYSNMQETATSTLPVPDAEPLFEAPIGLGNQLLFFPTNFRANAADGSYDTTGSQFQTLIMGTSPTDVLTQFNITEFGDAQIGGAGGTAATGTYAAMVGFLTVLETTSGPIAPVVIPFVGAFAPSDVLDYVNNFGTSVWSATVSIDISAYVPNATKIQLSLDNDLAAYSEPGTTASIQKKVVNGPAVVISVVPEPGTGILVGGGLLIMSLRNRRSRAA